MRIIVSSCLICVFMTTTAPWCAAAQYYSQTNLVSDLPGASHADPNLINPWGLAFSPTGFNWVANAGTGVATVYDGQGNLESPVVSIPGGAAASPTGVVYNGTTSFLLTSGRRSAPAQYIFDAENGTISAWSPKIPTAGSTTAEVVVDNSASGAVYKGLATAVSGVQQYLYAADFHNNHITVLNSNWQPVTTSGGFVDSSIPAGYAPFNIQNINGLLYVAYAMQDATGHDDVPGAGHGYVDVFDSSGNLLHHLIDGGLLNSPWGLAMAPANFGLFSGDLLVGNFGNGKINAFNPTTGALVGTLADQTGTAIQINGLWALEFGNGYHHQTTNALFFTAGIKNEADGLYGKITAVTTKSAATAAIAIPEPATYWLALLAAAGAFVLVGRRRSHLRYSPSRS